MSSAFGQTADEAVDKVYENLHKYAIIEVKGVSSYLPFKENIKVFGFRAKNGTVEFNMYVYSFQKNFIIITEDQKHQVDSKFSIDDESLIEMYCEGSTIRINKYGKWKNWNFNSRNNKLLEIYKFVNSRLPIVFEFVPDESFKD